MRQQYVRRVRNGPPPGMDKYPLCGPTKGPTYCPEPKLVSAARGAFLMVAGLAIVGAAVILYAIIEYLFLPINY